MFKYGCRKFISFFQTVHKTTLIFQGLAVKAFYFVNVNFNGANGSRAEAYIIVCLKINTKTMILILVLKDRKKK